MLIVSALYNTGSALLYCYMSELTFSKLGNLDKAIYHSKWYLYPNSLQKDLIIVIGNSQRAKYFTGFGMINLSLNTFSKVSKLLVPTNKYTEIITNFDIFRWLILQ